ncbi:MAG: Holliday junction branch migration protein RuvA, partial [Ectothiorhodospiraceae bacterium]|nr:Holliday junction branch migration protein RuvA [Ectothiorhodospiraceae bacterium]
MIDFLRGILIRKQPMHAVLDVNGVGYALHISLQTFDALPKPGSEVELATRLVVREDSMHLYGFGDEEERAMFELLTSVSGVGAKVAMAVLSGSSVAELRDHIGTSNVGALKSIPGIGKKTA